MVEAVSCSGEQMNELYVKWQSFALLSHGGGRCGDKVEGAVVRDRGEPTVVVCEPMGVSGSGL